MTSISASDPWSAHLSLLYTEEPIGARPAAAASDGFRWVESWWVDDPSERTALLGALGEGRVHLACMNAYAGDLAAGDRGALNDPARHDDAVEALAAAIDSVSSVGGRAVNVLVGRGDDAPPRTRELDAVRRVLTELAPVAAAARVTLVVEHLNEHDVPGYLLPTPRAAVDLVVSVDHEAVKLLYDAYHAARTGLDPARDAAGYAGLIGHAQYADAPGRTAPGTGTGDPWAFAATLAEGGYHGPIGLEFEPRGSTPDALQALTLGRPSPVA